MNPFDKPRVTIRVCLNGRDTLKEIQIDPEQAQCLAPLHKNHDFPGILGAHREAMSQRQKRREVAAAIANALTRAIMEEAESQDPRNGYTPAENREFYNPSTPREAR